MKKFKIIFLFLAFLTTGTLMTSCGDGASKTEKTAEQGKEYTSAYICPMHCKGSGSDKAGICPVCGMDYEKNPKAQGADAAEGGHDHNHDGHDHGHDHDSHEGHNH